MLKYIWRLVFFFFGLLTLGGLFEVALGIWTRRYIMDDDLIHMALTSIAATICLLCHDKATSASARQSQGDSEKKT
jgi:exosortase/archaeosortase